MCVPTSKTKKVILFRVPNSDFYSDYLFTRSNDGTLSLFNNPGGKLKKAVFMLDPIQGCLVLSPFPFSTPIALQEIRKQKSRKRKAGKKTTADKDTLGMPNFVKSSEL